MKKILGTGLILAVLVFTLSCATDSQKMAAEVEEQIQSADLPNVEVTADQEGVHIITTGLLFEPESSTLTDEITAQLDELGIILQGYDGHDVLVEGHSALVGAASAIQKLSDARARAIADYLLEKGYVTSSQITSIGRGASEPVATNDTKEGRALNRRVEITILN